jgi:hypothetical protein
MGAGCGSGAGALSPSLPLRGIDFVDELLCMPGLLSIGRLLVGVPLELCLEGGWKKIPAGRPSGLCITMPEAAEPPPSRAAVSEKYSSASILSGEGLVTGGRDSTALSRGERGLFRMFSEP